MAVYRHEYRVKFRGSALYQKTQEMPVGPGCTLSIFSELIFKTRTTKRFAQECNADLASEARVYPRAYRRVEAAQHVPCSAGIEAWILCVVQTSAERTSSARRRGSRAPAGVPQGQ